ncbi:MAG: hypothetical protein IJS88_04885 [Alphaproteobacteria bacterium]|nr:hypothetical protein [Alphaproteobacteria bacterium]
MRLVGLLFAILCCVAVNASAQSFSSSSGIVAESALHNQPTVKKNEVSNTPTAAKSDNQMQNAVVNISGEKDQKSEPTYDNTFGKVVSFKIVKGKVVFDKDDERKILISYDNYSVSKGMDGVVRCKMRVYVLNDMTERLNSLGFKLIWPEINTSINLVKVNPGVRTYRDIMLLGEGCFSMDKNPTIEVNRCRVIGKSEEECANAVKWFKHLTK